MIPLSDDNPTRTTPVVTYTLIALNVALFLWQQLAGEIVTARFALFPFLVAHTLPAVPEGLVNQSEALQQYQLWVQAAREYNLQPAWLTLLSYQFLHGSWMHLIGNMVFLAIFGNNIEDELGHLKYLLFYLVCGVCAALAQILVSANSFVPTVGASGAIAGVLGAYYLAHPHARVKVLILMLIITIIELPAGWVLGFWFLLQLAQSLLGWAQPGNSLGGVAYMAHASGFIVGYLLMKVFGPPRRPRPRYYAQPDRFDFR